jgi:hypothetical protein
MQDRKRRIRARQGTVAGSVVLSSSGGERAVKFKKVSDQTERYSYSVILIFFCLKVKANWVEKRALATLPQWLST